MGSGAPLGGDGLQSLVVVGHALSVVDVDVEL